MGEKHRYVRETLTGCLSHAPLPRGPGPATQACVLTGNQTSDLLVSRLAFSPLSHTGQGCCYSSNVKEQELREFR